MRETTRSLRAYFIFFGALAALSVVAMLAQSVAFEMLLNAAPQAVFAGEFLYVGVRLKDLLELKPQRISQAIYTAVAMDVVQVIFEMRSLGAEAIGQVVGKGLFGLLLCLYLLANVRRLAREAALPKP